MIDEETFNQLRTNQLDHAKLNAVLDEFYSTRLGSYLKKYKQASIRANTIDKKFSNWEASRKQLKEAIEEEKQFEYILVEWLIDFALSEDDCKDEKI